jgi:hypothetical protein
MTIGMLAALTLVGGCHHDTVDSKAVAADPAAAPTGSVPALAFTAAVPVRAGGLPVEVRYALARPPLTGQPFTVTLSLSSADAQPALRVHWSGDDGLVPDGNADDHLDRLEPGSGAALESTFRPSTAGLHLVTVDVSLDIPGSSVARSVQLPVLVTEP